jgi:hypothetical protein
VPFGFPIYLHRITETAYISLHIWAPEEVLDAGRERTILGGIGLEKRYHSLLEFIKGYCVC